jgi:hypothetical protein
LAATRSKSLDEAVDAMLSENSNTDEGTVVLCVSISIGNHAMASTIRD